MTDTKNFRKKSALGDLCLFSAELTLPVALLSLGITLPLAWLAELPLWSGALMSGALWVLLWIGCGVFLNVLKRREAENLAILADRIDQPVEYRTTIIFHNGRHRCPGYLLLTYEDCYLVARGKGGLFAKVNEMKTETFVLHKSRTFSIHVLGEHKVMLMTNAVEGYELSVGNLKRLIYLMDRDFWRITGRKIAGYLG